MSAPSHPLELAVFAPLTAESIDQPVRAAEAAIVSVREARHKAAVERMMERHGRLVYRVAFAVVRHAADAEDVAQETFLQLLRSSPERIAQVADERGYLARTAWRLACRLARKRP